jgi:predicted nucleic acid-binding Zn ribbon protein
MPGRPRPAPPREEIKSRYLRSSYGHRRVMERHLGRKLETHELVHHLNGDKLDNRPENLMVVDAALHGLLHTRHPITKNCVVCGEEFTPHKTKRIRQQTCSWECRNALIKIRWSERKAREAIGRHLMEMAE